MDKFIDKILNNLVHDFVISSKNKPYVKEALIEYALACLVDSKIRKELEDELNYDLKQK